jgi:hypothetical protein
MACDWLGVWLAASHWLWVTGLEPPYWSSGISCSRVCDVIITGFQGKLFFIIFTLPPPR